MQKKFRKNIYKKKKLSPNDTSRFVTTAYCTKHVSAGRTGANNISVCEIDSRILAVDSRVLLFSLYKEKSLNRNNDLKKKKNPGKKIET